MFKGYYVIKIKHFNNQVCAKFFHVKLTIHSKMNQFNLVSHLIVNMCPCEFGSFYNCKQGKLRRA